MVAALTDANREMIVFWGRQHFSRTPLNARTFFFLPCPGAVWWSNAWEVKINLRYQQFEWEEEEPCGSEREESGPCSTTMAAGRESPNRSEDKTSRRQNEGKKCIHSLFCDVKMSLLMPLVAFLVSHCCGCQMKCMSFWSQ